MSLPLVVGLVYVLGEVMSSSGDGESARQAGPPPAISSTEGSAPADQVPTGGEASKSPGRRNALAPQRRRPVNLTLSAVLGESWVEAHSGSPTGPLLYRGTLARGRQLRLAAARIWVRFGAVSNLSFVLNGRPVLTGLQGTVDVFVTPQGIRRT
jgi:hypothetical protein